MPPWFIALVFTLLGIVAAWAIRNSLSSGIAGNGLYRFDVNTNPLGFAAIIAGKAFVIVFAIVEILHALGLTGDPRLMPRALFG
jgi:hypothetical protein